MRLVEAFDLATSALNSGGVPVVLYRLRRLPGIERECRIYEVRLSWTPPKDPYSSMRSPTIIETRTRTDAGWTEWAATPRPFSVDDLMPYVLWGWRSFNPRVRLECERCVEAELRTDEGMLKVYGPFIHKQHRCPLKLFTEGGPNTIEEP